MLNQHHPNPLVGLRSTNKGSLVGRVEPPGLKRVRDDGSTSDTGDSHVLSLTEVEDTLLGRTPYSVHFSVESGRRQYRTALKESGLRVPVGHRDSLPKGKGRMTDLGGQDLPGQIQK